MSEDANAISAKTKGQNSPLLISLLPFVVLFGATLVLFWLSQGDMEGTYKYWEFFVPVVAVISLVSGWGQAYISGKGRLWYLVKQCIHWGLLIGLIYIFNTQGIRDTLSTQQYVAIILYLLALTALITAVQMDFKLVFFGIFLLFCAYVIMVPDNNPTLLGIGNLLNISDPQSKPLIVASALAAIGFVASLFLLIMFRGAMTSKRLANQRAA